MTRRRLLYLLAAACLTLAVTPALAANGSGGGDRLSLPTASSMTGMNGASSSAPFRDGIVLVGFRGGTTAAQRTAIERRVGATEQRVIGAGTHVLRVSTGRVLTTIARLKTNPYVRYAEPDYLVRADMTPNDPLYNKLWGMPKIVSNKAWDITTGSKGIVVGVVDTGIDYNHPDLADNVWSNAGSINACPAGTHGFNVLTNSCDPMDDHNHGTHVSGTIGAIGNNGMGVIGVDPTVSIMGLKFLNSGGSGSTSGAIAAIDWAVKAKVAGVNVRVLSNSWGGGGYSQALKDEIDKAGARDIRQPRPPGELLELRRGIGRLSRARHGHPLYDSGWRLRHDERDVDGDPARERHSGSGAFEGLRVRLGPESNDPIVGRPDRGCSWEDDDRRTPQRGSGHSLGHSDAGPDRRFLGRCLSLVAVGKRRQHGVLHRDHHFDRRVHGPRLPHRDRASRRHLGILQQ